MRGKLENGEKETRANREHGDPACDSEDPYRPAMSLLDFYVNNANRDLSARQRASLERAKAALQKRLGQDAG